MFRRVFVVLAFAIALPTAAKVKFTDYPLPKTGKQKPTEMVALGGAVYFIDEVSGSINRIDGEGAITRFDSVGPAGALAAGPDGALWYTALSHIHRLDPETGETDETRRIFVPTLSYWPELITGPDGNFWLASGCADRLTRISLAGTITHFPTTSGGCPYELANGPDGGVWFTEHYGNRVGRMRTNGQLTEFAVTNPDYEIYPDDIVAGPDGNLWFTSNYGWLTRITTEGVMTAQSMMDINFGWMTVGEDGNLWIGSGAKITKVDTSFQVLGTHTLTGDAQIRSLVTAGGNVWASAYNTSAIARVKMDGTLTELPALSLGGDPTDVVHGPDGRLWFTETKANAIGAVNASGEFVEYDVPTPDSAPRGITAGGDGALWFVESAAHKVGRITVDGTITEFPLPGGSAPADIVLGPDGNYWITLNGTNAIARMTPAGAVTEFPLPGGRLPRAIIAAPDGNLWFTQQYGTIGRMAPDGTGYAEFAANPNPMLVPRDLVVGPDGAIWYTDGLYLRHLTLGGTASEVSQVSNASYIAAGADGSIWLSSPIDGLLTRFKLGSGVQVHAVPQSNGQPRGLAFGPGGDLWFAQSAASYMGRVEMAFDAYGVEGCFGTQHVSGTMAKFLDLAIAAPPVASDYSATIWWGDNTSSPGTVTISGNWIHVTGSHTYASAGVKSVNTTIVKVANPAKTATATSTFTPSPASPEIRVTGTFCPGAMMSASVPVGTGMTYEWYVPNMVASSAHNVSFIMPQSGSVEVTVVAFKSGFCPTTSMRTIRTGCGVVGDSDGDGRADVLWRDGSGQNALWKMSGFTKVAGSYLPSQAAGWAIAAHGDFDGDRKGDILWRDAATGGVQLWLMDGATRLAIRNLPLVYGPWKIAGTGDFDGNGIADVLWRQPDTGANTMWSFHAGATMASAAIEGAPRAWSVGGIGDLDGDGRSDIVWRRNDNGENSAWLWNGTAKGAGAYLEYAPVRWQLAAVADFDGDGKADLLWRDPVNGENALWRMNGLQKIGGHYLEYAPARWKIGPVRDFDGDGLADIFWRDPATGENTMWRMVGPIKTAGQYLEYAPNVWTVFR